MTTLANLIVRLSADTSSYQQNLKMAQRSLNTWGRQMEGTGLFLTKSLTVPILATAGSFAFMAKSAASTGDMLFNLAQKTGVSVGRLAAYRLATKLSGVTMEDFAGGIGRLSAKMFDVQQGSRDARVGFDKLGISVFDSSGKLRANEEVLLAIADKFSKMQDGTLKTALAMEFFGKSGANLIPMLNQGSKGLEKTTEASKNLGAVWDTKTTPAATAFNNSLTTLKFTLEEFKERLGGLVIKNFGDDLNDLTKSLEKSKTFNKLEKNLNGLMESFDKLPGSAKLGIIGVVGATALAGPAILVLGNLIRNSREVLGLMGSLSKLAAGGFGIRAGVAAMAGAGVGGLALGAGAGVGGFMLGKKLIGERLAERLFRTPTLGPRLVGVGETVGPGIRIPPSAEELAKISNRMQGMVRINGKLMDAQDRLSGIIRINGKLLDMQDRLSEGPSMIRINGKLMDAQDRLPGIRITSREAPLKGSEFGTVFPETAIAPVNERVRMSVEANKETNSILERIHSAILATNASITGGKETTIILPQ
ncbi:MAG: phage tail tape measure protein [Candidatus Brocadiales bacterium]|nr:phage tail tape measure protein [Candidatus Brocadiales bacterium]